MPPQDNQNIDISPDVIPTKKIGDVLVNNGTYGINTLGIGKTIQSTNFKKGSTGWRLASNGVLEAHGTIIT
jgi:hypothetical protein